MNDIEKRAHDIALFSTASKAMALINETARRDGHLSFSFYEMYKAAYNEALTLVKQDFADSNN